ncbi:MAG: hypothetical protein H7203_02650 [Rhizobacter sp.]|nr:hypothetical protein [Burkholderiales bacterium]
MLRKKRNEKKSLSLKQFFVLIAFFFRFSGPINGDPSSRYLIASRWGLGFRWKDGPQTWLHPTPFALSAAKGLMHSDGSFATFPLMPRGSHFSSFAKKSNQKKATPTIGLFLRCSEKSGTEKLAIAQTVFCSYRFFLPLLGANQRGPVEQIFDRFAMRGTTKARVTVASCTL